MRFINRLIVIICILSAFVSAQSMLNKYMDAPDTLPYVPYHLTARPWTELNISTDAYLDAVENICRVAQTFQDKEGAIIDPYLHREHQYSTPYYAIALSVLLHEGRALDMKESAIKAMDHATKSFAQGADGIPDRHGEFYIAALATALEAFKGYVPDEKYNIWHERLQTPLLEVIEGYGSHLNNWRTYAMKGEWLRAKSGLTPKNQMYDFIEYSWNHQSQFEKIVMDKWNLYQDWSSDPQSLAVEAVGRGNLVGLLCSGYDGASAKEMMDAIKRGTQTSLLLMSPDGQCPPNGRTDDHVFNDVLYQLIYEAMAETALKDGDTRLAGQYRRAAMMCFDSIKRWKRSDGKWAGSYTITKNHFDVDDRVGYQPASQWGNYNGALIFHLAEAAHARQSDIEEIATPTEIGGYAITTDPRFATFTANAGGMQVFINTRGNDVPKYDVYWAPLGGVRFSRVGWDSRLGPSDGVFLVSGKKDGSRIPTDMSAIPGGAGQGVTFGPAWFTKGKWFTVADLPQHYRATPVVEFVHPLLVRFTLTYSTITGHDALMFRQHFTVTPDGVLIKMHAVQDIPNAMMIPILENDGRSLDVQITPEIISTAYDRNGDEQNFINLSKSVELDTSRISLQSTYGWLKPVITLTQKEENILFVYPRSATDPAAVKVRESFAVSNNGFESELGRVDGDLYIGRTSAGGVGDAIDLDGNGSKDVSFSESCGFVLQLSNNKVKAVETDKPVTMQYKGKSYKLEAFSPLILN